MDKTTCTSVGLPVSGGSFLCNSAMERLPLIAPVLLTYDARPEEMGVLLFDADGDGDLDLYAVSGSYEFEPDSPELQDACTSTDGQGGLP